MSGIPQADQEFRHSASLRQKNKAAKATLFEHSIFTYRSLSVIELLCLVYRFASEVDAELAEHVEVDGAHHRRGVSIAVLKVAYLLHRKLCYRVGSGTDSKRDKDFVGMESRIVVAHVVDLEVRYRLDNVW